MNFFKCLNNSVLLLALGVILFSQMTYAKTVRLQNGLSYFNGIYNGSEDCYLRQPYPDAATGKWPEFMVGYETYNGGGKNRSLLRFNLGDLNSALVASSHVTSAKLILNLVGVDGNSITNKTVYLYKISAANKTWGAGLGAGRSVPEVGAACWNWIAYDNTNYAPGDLTNCPNQTAGCPRRNPWAGDVTAFKAVWPILTTYKGNACGIAGIDYDATPVATATITVATGPAITPVEFTFSDPSHILSLIKDNNSNSGFLIVCPGIESGTSASYSTLRFGSSENTSITNRPLLSLVIDTLNAPISGISYTVGAAAKVSMHISDSTGKVVKELLFTSPRGPGENTEFWDCKDDPRPQRSDVATTVPNGTYTANFLLTQGLSSEYLMTVGTSGSIWLEDQMPGNHVNPSGIAVDSSGFYMSSTENECAVGVRKQTIDGSVLWVRGDIGGFNSLHTLCVTGGNIYAVSGGGQYVTFSASQNAGTPTGGQMGSSIKTTLNATGFTGQYGWDIAGRNGHVLVGNHVSNSICWVTPAIGAKIGSPIAVTDLNGIGVDLNGDAIVLDGTTIKKFAYGSTTGTTIASVSANLSQPNRMDIHPGNGNLYILDYGSMQVKVFTPAGVFVKAIGAAGGRKPYGTYNPADGFYHGTSIVTPDICVAKDSSFFIAEQEPLRRYAHYGYSGTFIKEWYGGAVYAPHATVDRDDPRIVWICHSYNTIMRCQIDYLNQTWKVIGNYRVNKAPLNPGYDWSRWNCVKRGGKTYIVSSQFPIVYYFDEVGDSLRPIAVAGNLSGVNGSWADLNGNGAVDANEVIAPPAGQGYSSNGTSQVHGVNYMDSNFVSYGNMMNGGTNWKGPTGSSPIPGAAVYAPKEIRMVNGVATPIYDLANLTQPFASNSEDVTAGWNHWMAQGGGVIDGKGGVYAAFPTNSEKFSSDSATWYPGTKFLIGGVGLVKGDQATGKIKWAVGQFSTTGGTPAPGQMCYVDHLLGYVRGCVAIADYYPIQYVYDSLGLYVGRFYDTKLPKGNKALPADNVLTVGEQFGGSAFEVTRTDIPGLTKGDVIFLSGSDNSVAVMRVKGFDGWKRHKTSFTVVGGKIVSQGGVDIRSDNVKIQNNNLTRASLRVSRTNAKVSLTYSIPSAAPVSLDIFNLQGKKIATLVNTTMDKGTHSIVWNNSNKTTSAGYYLVQLKAGNQIVTQRLTIVD